MSSLLHVQFQGLDESADPKALPPGTLLVADNCRMDKLRRLHKRWGTEGLAKSKVGGGSVSAGSRLFEAADGGIGLIDGTDAYVWAEDAALWQSVDKAPHLTGTKRPLADSAKSVHGVDCALSGDLLVSVWLASSPEYDGSTADRPVMMQIHDVTDWSLVMPATELSATGRHPRVVINGTKAVAFWTNSSGQLRYIDLTLSTLTLGTAASLKTGLAASSAFDVCVEGTDFYAAYETSGLDLKVEMFDSAYASTQGPTTMTAIASDFNDVSICATTGENGYVVWSEGNIGGTIKAVTFDPADTTVVTAASTLATVNYPDGAFVARYSSTEALVGWGARELDGSYSRKYFVTKTQRILGSDHSVTTDTARITRDTLPVSRPWYANSRWYVAASTMAAGDSDDTISPSSTVVLEIPTSAYSAATATHPHVATLENQIGGLRGVVAITPTFVRGWTVPVASDVAYCASLVRREEITDIDVVPPQSASITKLWTGGDVGKVLKNGRTSLVVAAAPGCYDGLTIEPYGFVRGPHIVDITLAAGGSVVNGTYQYAGIFVRKGPDGMLMRSPPSQIVTKVVTNSTVRLDYAPASVCGKCTENTGFPSTQAPTFIETYRTTVDGSILYKLTVEPIANVLENSPTAGISRFSDTRADSSLGTGVGGIALDTRPQMYVDTELEDLAPPGATTGTVHRGRFALIASDEFTVAMSKDATEDLTIVPGFNEVLTLTFATRKKALASLDEKLVAFGLDDIDVVFGGGPDSNGDSSDWQIQRLQTDVGCTNPRSVVVTPFGVAFQSRRGLEMLDRGLNVTPLGATIEDTLAAFPEITSAVLVAEEGEVRWTANESDGTNGVVIVWDYINKFWCVRRYKDAADADTTSMPIADAALINGVYTMLTAGGQVYREDKTTFLDNGTDFVERDVQIAHVSPAGANAWARYRRWQVLGTNVTGHDLKISVKRDYASSWEQDNTFAAGTTPTTVGPIAQARITPQYQKATAMALRLQDLTPSSGSVGTGAGPIWEAVTLEFDVKRSTARTSAAEQA